jgi:hypothetical protein
MAMEPYVGSLKNLKTRLAHCAAAFATSATMLLAVVSAFYSVSNEPVLADSPEARSAIAGCDALGDRVARQHCVSRLVAKAQAQDGGASQVATLAPHRRGAAQ